MQMESAKDATVTTRLMRIMRLRVALRCMLHTSRNTSRFSAISCVESPGNQFQQSCSSGEALQQVTIISGLTEPLTAAAFGLLPLLSIRYIAASCFAHYFDSGLRKIYDS
jgi:hypothetical protein